MNKEAILKDFDNFQTLLNHKRHVVNTLPLDTYISLQGNEVYYDTQSRGWKKGMFQAFVKAISYNRDSIRFRVLASNGAQKGEPITLDFEDILKWEPLKIEDLPTALSWTKYPLYEKMLRDGKLGPSGKSDLIPLKNLKINKSSTHNMVGILYLQFNMSCPVCNKDIHIRYKYTHYCNACRYSFRTKEDMLAIIKKGEVNANV